MNSENGIIHIPLTQGLFTTIDTEDFERVSQFKWGLQSCSKTDLKYVQTNRYPRMYLHRFIINAKKGEAVDHIDRNPLNNSRSNLRICSQKHNTWNRRPDKNSIYKGVTGKTDCNRSKPFRAQIVREGKPYSLGCFATPEEAARAYDEKAKELFGEFAYLNFPEDTEKKRFKKKLFLKKNLFLDLI